MRPLAGGMLALRQAGRHPGRHRQAPLCAGCAVPDQGFWKACTACGTGGRLLAGICRRCQLRRQLGELLAGPGGQVRPELRALHDTLADAERPDTALTWLKHAATRTVLAELAAGRRPLGRTALDNLPPGKPIEHLRAVLVATAALPARDEQLARIERWVSQAVSEHAGPARQRTAAPLRGLAPAAPAAAAQPRRGHHLWPARHGPATGAGRPVGLLGWLRERGLTLASCSQADLDAWLAGTDATRKAEAGHFVRWAISHGINRNLQFAATRWTGPAGPLDHDGRWQQARRLLHDGTLGAGDRVAGLLVLLYAQRLAAISQAHPRRHRHQRRHGQAPPRVRARRAARAGWPPSPATWPATRRGPCRASATRASHAGCSPAGSPAARSAPTGSASGSASSACGPGQARSHGAVPARHRAARRRPGPHCSASTSRSPSPGSTSPPETGPAYAADVSRRLEH